MKLRPFVIAVLPMLGLGSLLFAQVGPFTPPTLPGMPQAASRPAYPPINLNAPANLERTMHVMQRLVEEISTQLENKSMGTSTLAAVNALQVYTAVAKSALPDAIGELTGEAKTKAIADYHTRIIALQRTQLALEEAILADNRAAARTALSQLDGQKRDSHKAFGLGGDEH